MRAAVVVAGLACLLVAAAALRQAAPAVDNTAPEDDTDGSGWTDAAADPIDQVNPMALIDQNTIIVNAADANVQAFLAMIRASEGTASRADPYAVCYGYTHTIENFSDHPKLTGEWPGVPLDNLGPSYAGKISTAAGAYQIIRPTWQGCKRALALPDFGPASQDAAAVYLIRQAGALELVQAGAFDQAVQLCAREWASLPGANAPGQSMRRLADLRQIYADAGGNLA